MQKNYVRLIGHLGMDPEIFEFESGKKLVKVSLATNDNYKNQDGEWIQNTQWHNLALWDNIAEKAIKKFKKGLEIAVEGRIIYRSYTNKEGENKISTEIGVLDWILILK